MAKGDVLKRVAIALIAAVPAGGVGYFVRTLLEWWGILDPLAKAAGEWLKMSPPAGFWNGVGLTAFFALYIATLVLISRIGNEPPRTADPVPATVMSGAGVDPRVDSVIPIRDAIEIVIRHFAPEWGNERVPGSHMLMAAQRLREAAAKGVIGIEGRKEINRDNAVGDRFSTIWMPIRADFWETHEFDLATVLDPKSSWQKCETRTETAMLADQAPGYAGLRVREDEVRRIRPATVAPELVTIVHNYNNCTVYQYPDGTRRSELTTPLADPRKPTFALWSPAPFELVEANNVSSITDTGPGEFTIRFLEPVDGVYRVELDADGSIPFSTEEYPDHVSIKLKDKEPRRLKIIVRKLDDGPR